MNSMNSLDLEAAAATAADGGEYTTARVAGERRLVVVAPAGVTGTDPRSGFEGEALEQAGRRVLVGPLSPVNAATLRARLPWLEPRVLGLATSAGFGDRLGLGTAGHIRALRAVGGRPIAPILAQQSMREMSRTGRSPQQVVDDAMWAVFVERWESGYGADADHLKVATDIDRCLAAGFTFYTIDPGDHVAAAAERLDDAALREAFEHLPWQALEDTPAACVERYAGKSFDADGIRVALDAKAATVAAVKYGPAVAHVVAMYRHLAANAPSGRFELEVSLDETEAPTSHGEHVYVTLELRRLGVRWVSLAPRFVGRFEKGVDYIGDMDAFEADVAAHAAIARAFGPYKLSLHSGSDKFSIYQAAARETRGLVHLKTAGTSYLEALRTIAATDPKLFAEIYEFSCERYETDRASYHVSATLSAAQQATDGGHALDSALDDFHVRQILHVTFGSVLTAKDAAGRPRFADRFLALIRREQEAYAVNLVRHFTRHLEPFARS
jgi:tagaturonate epimerase